MYIVKKEDVLKEINKINNYLSKCMWMDFTYAQSHCGKIELFGAIDQTYNNYIDNYEIKVVFEHPHFVSSLFSWSLDTSKLFIQLCIDEEEKEMNDKYQIELGSIR